jgi:rare lipoprotein A
MMTKYFATAFVAVSTLLGAASHGAFARSPSRSVEAPAPNAPAPNAPAPNAPAPNAPTPNAWVGEIGKASYYGPHYHGRRAASGARFDQMALTAAHPWLPFGTKVKVILAGTGRSVIVTITDRLYSSRRVVDLSVGAARQLGIVQRGVAQVSLLPV